MTAEPIDTPTPEFRAHLEWEVARTLRREARLGAARRERHPRRMRIAGLVAICVAIGSASGFASAQVRDGARRDSLLDAERAELAMIALRLDLAKARLEDAARKFKIGAIASEQVTQAEAEYHAVEARVRRAQLNIEEIRLAALTPRNELSAPLVNGRDFVKERIEVDLASAQQLLTVTEKASADAERRVRVGAASELSQVEARLAATEARVAMAVDAERLRLRREFVEKGTSADELVKRLEATQLRFDLVVAQQSLELTRLRVTTARRQREVGMATELDLMRAQVDMKERELELSQLMARLRRLGEVRRDSMP